MTPRPHPSQWRSRAVIVIIALLAVVPFVLAWYYAKHPELIASRSNYGQLALPPRPIDPAGLLKNPVSPPEALAGIKGRWVLLHVAAGGCGAVCADTLHKTHQVRLMVNKDIARVARLLLVPVGTPFQADDDLVVAGASEAVTRVLAEATGGPSSDDRVYLLDPLGNLVLWYAGGFDPYGLLKDLKHLLRASQIG
ncbi:hypothetical protein SAMN02949497_1773 [Methylomagnum ishizawai]|uniref:Cytochrome oxidase Cu insertion factor, SCO1/SenC/PrrC family n=1 Tax=Methylomagnum ishizawai TaxID=1760988 RepID=A0A1Y6CVT9_9GAMM|nr:hypothetical protein [Methylomagnum ishizawai]SMF94457.1 hypothetical protein SAMN02949497_1773 [Methylomagnum ishizawai]